MTNTVAIIGRGKTRKHLVYRDGVDYWAFNDNAMTVPADRLTAMFEMHMDWETTDRYNVIGCEGYRDWLRQEHPFTIWMHTPEVPSAKAYPLEALHRKFATSTTPYALALAIYLGYKKIEMWGIEADRGYEYDFAREAIFYWMGRAEGAGCEIVLHPENKLFHVDSLYWQRSLDSVWQV